MKIFKTLNFNPTNINLYYEAFTHTSYSNENPSFTSYERLEFLGDAILEFIISDYLYKERHLTEGVMTKMRANYVCEEALATYAHDLKFEEDIKLGSGELETGPNNTILADVFEAFVAAMYLDIGFEKTQEMVLKIMLKYITKGVDFLHDYKSTLQELVQTDKKSVVYEIISEEGPAHNRRFECVVKVDGHILGRGIGSSKKASEQEAAKAALAKQAK
jgi:ribonuclease III